MAESAPESAPGPMDAQFPTRRQTVALVSVVLLVAAGILAYRLLAPETYTITGTFTLNELIDSGPEPCSGKGGFDDVRSGAEVVVRDGEDATLARAALGPGRRVGEDAVAVCVFGFTVDDVPESDFYAVAVGRRGELTYSFDDMVANDWTVAFSLGDFD